LLLAAGEGAAAEVVEEYVSAGAGPGDARHFCCTLAELDLAQAR
jgi:hypothetical protein